MPVPTAPPRPNHEAARRVTALWSQWVDPVEEAFADLAAQVELEALRRRLSGRTAEAPPTTAETSQITRGAE